MENRRVPKLRFPKFTDEWEQRKLGDVVGVYDGTHQTPDYKDQGVMFVSVENIQTLTSDKYISEEDYEKNYSLVPEVGDILMTRIGDIGTANIVKSPEPLAYYVSLALLKNAKLNAEYLKANISAPAFQNELWLRTLHTAYPKKINKDEIGKCMISIAPQKGEQELIGGFFENLDNLITLHQCKVDQMKKYKKGMLQKMFPHDGQLEPELRFPGFAGTWEQRKLSDISDVRDGTHDSPSYLSEGHPFVTSKNVKDGYINYDDIQYISDEDFEAINKRSKVDINDILMGMIGTIGNLALIRTEPDFALKNVALIKDTKQVSYMYLYHYLQSPSTERQLLSGLDGGTQKFVSLKNIRELNIMVPSEAEQIKVGGFIEALDNLITLHQRQLHRIREYKKGLLQQMFI